MTLQEILARHSITEAGLVADIEEYITSAVTENTGGMIPRHRFDEVIQQRNQMRDQLSETEKERELWTDKLTAAEVLKTENAHLSHEVNTLRNRFKETRRQLWEPYAQLLNMGADDPRYPRVQKMRGDFRFPTADKPLGADDIEHNLLAIQPYLKIGLFDIPIEPDGARPQSPATGFSADLTDIFKEFGG